MILVTLNSKKYGFNSIYEALTDKAFNHMINTCGYSDTGGGWKHTYRELKKLSEKLKTSDKAVGTGKYPEITIERTFTSKDNTYTKY